MHEMSLMENALQVVDDLMVNYNGAKVNEIVLKVGRLANCIPGALEFAFEALTREGPYKDAKLVIEKEPVLLKCAECSQVFEAGEFPWTCTCGSNAIEIIGGTEVYVANIDIDESE
ncbi:MAG: hydrogenase maturation nickel metallochaperone HypA [Clostridia bacterium]|jgi:hydrogenase nickel incorporation protein HypA/HybF|nr:hydrogenase maturation nickel metallochaperone HypA [Clostridia bacterium]